MQPTDLNTLDSLRKVSSLATAKKKHCSMCMIAGYIGKESAADVLALMQKRQESVFGGFYSGIATCDKGRLYRERAIGSFEVLNSVIKKGMLPGNIEIAHSRTNSGGGVSWAQPRMDLAEKIATAGNDCLGVLSSPLRTSMLAEQLLTAGLDFQTKSDSPIINSVA